LGRLYGQAARRPITALSLFGGLASTVCWPLSTFFLHEFGWRGTCMAYAAIHLCICLALYLLVLPRDPGPIPEEKADETERPAPSGAIHNARALFVLLAVTLTISSVLSTVISVHLLTMLQARDLSLAAAVALGALIGPAQVAARFIEMLIARYHHPVWTHMVSVVSLAIGLALLWSGVPLIALALILYGAGIGLESIARATLPLSLFGAANYAPLMGRLARPSLIAQAAAPSIGAALMQGVGPDGTLAAIVAVAALNVVLALGLLALQRRVVPG
jgi:predicted MFS family arabinose efflux permease